jgi:hypothetical protein
MEDLTWTGIKALHDRALEAAQEVVAMGEEADPQLIICKAKPDGELLGSYILPPYLTKAFFERGLAGKNAFAMVLHDMLVEDSETRTKFVAAMKFEPNALVQVNEAWATSHARDANLREVPAPSEDPNRREVLMISVHTPTQTVPVLHNIAQNPRRVVRGAFPEEGKGKYRGRFTKQSDYDIADMYKQN